jgi:hypothetical protein
VRKRFRLRIKLLSGLLVKVAERLLDPLRRLKRRRPDLDPRRRWAGSTRWWRRAKRLGLALLIVGLAVITVTALVSFRDGVPKQPVLPWATKQCQGSGYACNIVSSLFFTAAPLAFGVAVFLAWRYRALRFAYLRRAKDTPSELVETAGTNIFKVVGRDDLCDVVQRDLRDGHRRRPQVLVGGLGIGKTAILVQLTDVLARRGAIPVPIRLRDVADEVDFLELARERFMGVVGNRLRVANEGERVWRQLVKDDRVVVLADGLEEAFADEDAGKVRHHRIRVAVRRAREEGYPLIIASRPHAALQALDAALVRVEPLSEEAALEYLRGVESRLSEPALAQIIEAATLTETPLYLRLAHELHAEDLLLEEMQITRPDRASLRCQLLDRWLEALVERKLQDTEDIPLDEAQRRAVVEHLSALACVGLRDDTQQVTFDTYDAEPATASSKEAERAEHQDFLRDRLEEELGHRLRSIGGQEERTALSERGKAVVEIQAAASKAVRLKLVEPFTNGVRFPHSILQAYLGARILSAAFDDENAHYLSDALKSPGRELLLALVMYSRMAPDDAEEREKWQKHMTTIRARLIANRVAEPEKRLDVASAAVEIDTSSVSSGTGETASELYRSGVNGAEGGLIATIATEWGKLAGNDDAVQEAKLKLIGRVGEAARLPPGRPGAYRCLYEICCREELYSVRLAAAQEIGNGGDVAFDEIESAWGSEEEARSSIGSAGPIRKIPHWTGWAELLSSEDGEDVQRCCALRGWILPMLVGSTINRRDEADERLRNWMKGVGRENPMPLSVEAALAQGFKHAANRRPRHSHEQAESRALLQSRAAEMIYKARFWYSRLSLLHALCLWQLSRMVYPGRVGAETSEGPQDAKTLVGRWLRRPKGEYENHPFVRHAANLAVDALDKRQPERFIWIDESGVTTKVGSRPKRRRETHSGGNLWIAPSAGWMALEPRAQQLVADVLILLNLAERGDSAEYREERLGSTNQRKLPLCLTDERRSHLKPSQTVGIADLPNPGEDCKAGCPVALCPYPPRGQQPYRVELSEAFCRRQQLLFGRLSPLRTGSWQEAPRAELRRFWREMEDRART